MTDRDVAGDAAGGNEESAAKDLGEPEAREPDEPVIVAVGASAGGLESYKRLLDSLPGDSGVAFVLIQHLDPSHESLMAELLSRHSDMPVQQITDGALVRPDQVYMNPPNRFVVLREDRLYLEPPPSDRPVRQPIDHFFRSLAAARGERSVCVVLSGTGSDGAAGLREVKAGGGMVIAQDPADAEYDGMPQAAIATGVVDHVLPIRRMAEIIVPYARHPYVRDPHSKPSLADAAPQQFRAILRMLEAQTDHDFSRYKQGTLTRRIERRMGVRQAPDAEAYLGMMRADRNEADALFRDMLIGVTRFFREPEAWEQLAALLEQRLQEMRGEKKFRVWIPGCSTGEEAYSLAILLFDLQEKLQTRFDLQIFGTDVDTRAVDHARAGVYGEGVLRDVPDGRVERHFVREGDAVRVNKRLRETCVFAVQNLLADPPFSRLDLISCRNVLIYLEGESQRAVLDMFHFALKEHGILFLGSSESPGRRRNRFEALSQPHRIYRKVGRSERHGVPLALALDNQSSPRRGRSRLDSADPSEPGTVLEISRRALLEDFAPASVVVDRQGLIQHIHGPVRRFLDFPEGDPDLDVGAMALEGLRARVRAALRQAWSSGDTVTLLAPRVKRQDEVVAVRVRARPLPATNRKKLCLLSFMDESPGPIREQAGAGAVPGASASSSTVEVGSEQDLQMELQATREDLQSTIEELESANEELKASNEEVMSMNEELQSTNEELETSREELQSLNEELSTVNNQLHDKVAEVEAVNDDLSNLLVSADVATLFLDRDLRIRRYTPATVRLMNLIDSDIGRPLSDLAPRVNDPDLDADAQRVLRDLVPIEREVQNDSNRCYMRRITPFRASANRIDGVVVTFADISSVKEAYGLLEVRERQQAEVAALGRAALSGETLSELLDRAARGVADQLGVDCVKVLQLEPDGGSMLLVAGVGWRPGLVGQARLSAGLHSQAGFALQSRSPVIVDDLRNEKRFHQPQLLLDHDIVSGISVAIGPEEEPWGVIGAHSRRPLRFSIDDTNFLLNVANVLWQSIRRERIEQELRVSEERTAAFLRNSSVAGWMKDTEGRYVFVSDTLIDHFGLDRSAWLGRTDQELFPQEVAEALRSNDARAMDGADSLETTEDLVRPDGSEEHWLVSKFPFTDADGNRFVGGVGVHVTEQVRAQQELEVSERKLQVLIDATSVGVAFATEDGEILRANDALLRSLGLDAHVLQDRTLTWHVDLLPRDDHFAQQMRELGAAGVREPRELQRLNADGETVWFLASAVRIDPETREYVAFLVDISRQKQAEMALADSEERMSLAARLAGFGAYYGDLERGTLSWSPELRRIYGIRDEDASPQSLEELPGPVHDEDRERVVVALRQSWVPEGGGRLRVEYRIVRPDGEVRWLLLQGRTIFKGREGLRRASRLAGVALDITQRRRFEEELEAARRLADAANEAKSQFLANMSHEIRTPMTAILGFAEVLQSRLTDADARACVRTIMDNGRYLCELLDDILDIEKIESGKQEPHPETVDVLGLLSDVRSLMSVRADDKDLDLSLEIVDEVPRQIVTDGRFLRQILLNLVGNAIKFTSEGSVCVSCRCLRDRERLVISVTDTGVGISSDDLNRMFMPFEQVDTTLTGGTGLGLAISRALAELLGGSISCESSVGEGSVFSVDVPTGSLEQAEWIASASATEIGDGDAFPLQEELPRVPGRILLADDRRDIRVLVRQFLEAAGAELEAVENGADALEVWRKRQDAGRPFDAVLMDIQMPVMDGRQATRRLREAGFRGPVFALTATVGQRDRERAIAAGCDDVVVKPIERGDLLRKLAASLRPDPQPQTRTLELLVVDDNEDTTVALQMLLEHRGYRVATATSASEALAAARRSPPDVALLDLNLGRDSGADLLTRLKQLPGIDRCVFVCVSGRVMESGDWQRMGFDHWLAKPVNVEQLERLFSRVS